MEKKNKHKFKRFPLPSTQKCLCYVPRKRVLFSAGTDGMVLAWVVDKIFEQKDGIDDPNEPVDKKKEQEKFRSYLCENTPWFLGGAATCIIDLPNIEQIATGSYKKKIELWDLKTESNKNFDMDLESSAIMGGSTKDKKIKGSKKNKTIDEIKVHEEKAKEPLKRLEGHRMAIREIAYSESYKILVSVGFDFKVMVWNPYSKDAVMKLDGHESPLVGVNCPKGLDCFITCDNKGVINVWNIKDYSCLQSFNVAGVNQVTSMRVIPKHRRLVVGSRIFKVYEYKQPFVPTTSNDNQILCALFSDIRFELYISGANTVMVWNARNGKPIRVLKNCFESDITCMALDKDHRKLILGSSRGEIKVFDVLSGVWIRPYLESHAEENGEISFIAYANEDQNIITAAWDKTVKIHRDDRNDATEEPSDHVMRGLKFAHSRDISCGDYSHNLGLIATGGRDNKVRIWEYEKMKFIDEVKGNNNEVAIVKFLNPFSLLLSADNTGWIHIWLIFPHVAAGEAKCIVSWRNNHSLDSHSPVTAVDCHYEPSTGEFYLIMGDERGMVKTQDIAIIIQEYNLKPIDVTKNDDGTPNKKRNPWRYMKVLPVTLDVGMEGVDNKSDGGQEKKGDNQNDQPISNLKGGDIQSLYPFKAHKDIIKAIRYISATDKPLIFTAGLDKMAYIWGLDTGEKGDSYVCKGKLLQGYMMKPNYYWDFPLSNYDDNKESRRDKIDLEFEKVKEIRKNQKTYKKQAEQVAAKYGNMQSSLGFNATSLLGLDFNDAGTTGFHTKPASYKMSTKVDEKENLASTFYDDTGRGLRSLQNKKLIEKARKVIDRQNKQDSKDLKSKMNMTGGKGSSLVGAGHQMMQGTANSKMYSSQMGGGKNSGFGTYTKEDLMLLEEEEDARQKARKIGPFAFLIDDDIDTEVLTNQQVFDDLKELEDILGQGNETNANAVVKTKSKKR